MDAVNPILSISELTRRIKNVLEYDFANLTVQGEISNFKRHSSGHLYFTLKDESAQLSAVMWRSRAAGLFFTPQDGMKVVVRGKITVYEVRGVYQIDVTSLQPLGAGELQLAFERLKRQLAEEGLFDPGTKKPLPLYPRRIGIITSPTGAALKDMLNIFARRCPYVEPILLPVRVQGVGAAEEIACAIGDCCRYNDLDVIILGRGGGSLEDLWAFNEEIVARAIYQSTIPIISAVGHEIDFTIADFVADLRAPTPSAAAELVAPHMREIVENLHGFCYTSKQIISERLVSEQENIHALIRSYAFNKPIDMLRQHGQHLDELRRAITRILAHRFTLATREYRSLHQRFLSVSPHSVLRRGYAIVRKGEKAVLSAAELCSEDAIEIDFHDGGVRARITQSQNGSSHP